MTTTVAANEAENRYEVSVDDDVAGFAAYRLAGDVVTFTHTEIDSRHEGQGLASELIRQALDDVRGKGWRVIPECPFVREFIDKHADYQDLLAY